MATPSRPNWLCQGSHILMWICWITFISLSISAIYAVAILLKCMLWRPFNHVRQDLSVCSAAMQLNHRREGRLSDRESSWCVFRVEKQIVNSSLPFSLLRQARLLLSTNETIYCLPLSWKKWAKKRERKTSSRLVITITLQCSRSASATLSLVILSLSLSLCLCRHRWQFLTHDLKAAVASNCCIHAATCIRPSYFSFRYIVFLLFFCLPILSSNTLLAP